jgi:hypothetical protein
MLYKKKVFADKGMQQIGIDYEKINSTDLFNKLNDKEIILNLITMPAGIELLAKTTNENGRSILHEIATLFEDVTLKLITNDAGKKLFAKTRNAHGWSALHEAVHHNIVAIELTKTENDLKLLANTKTNTGWSALHVVMYNTDIVSKLLEKGYIKLLADSKDDRGISALFESICWNIDIVKMINKIPKYQKFLIDTKNNEGVSIMDELKIRDKNIALKFELR